MKIKSFAVIIALFSLMMGTAKADNVDLQTARQVGAFYFAKVTLAKAPVAPEALTLAEQFDNPTLSIPAVYAFNVEDNGFVVVAANDAVDPILAYSPTGSLSEETMSPACRYMLESYAKLISSVQNLGTVASKECANQWKSLIEQTYTPSHDPSKAVVLVKARWGQGDPYNCFCPKVGNERCLTGCVATAMAQIIHYWKFPLQGGLTDQSVQNWHTATCPWNGQTMKYKFMVDSNKFLFDSMPNSIRPNSEWNKRRAIGKLNFACGVTVKMSWGVDASGAVSQNVPSALKYFKYDNVVFKYRQGTTSSSWIALMHSEIDDNARPIYYAADDPNPEHTGVDRAGHAFVIAGSDPDNTNRFYVNWGWSASDNGYFTFSPMDNMEFAGGYTFTHGHEMAYQIYPNRVSIEENTQFSTVQAYPNPTTDYLIIPADANFNLRLSVYSIDGKMVDNLVVPAGSQEYRLDVRNYPAGTYFYRLNGSACKFVVE